jgi:5-formyltetrahydrofolate cyclo-ligase
MRKSLRSQLRAARRQLSPQQQHQATAAICRLLACNPRFRLARRIALYLANDGEVNLQPLLNYPVTTNKTAYLPLMSDVLRPWEPTRLLFQACDPRHEPLVKNHYGIAEPVYDQARLLPAAMLNLVLLPLVGFDSKGNRLGMGKGYYDRTFAHTTQAWHKPVLLGVAHSCQEVDSLPAASWDVPLDGLVTERSLVWFR